MVSKIFSQFLMILIASWVWRVLVSKCQVETKTHKQDQIQDQSLKQIYIYIYTYTILKHDNLKIFQNYLEFPTHPELFTRLSVASVTTVTSNEQLHPWKTLKARPLTFLFGFSPLLLHTGVILIKHALLNAAELKGRRLIVSPPPPPKNNNAVDGWFLALCSILFLRIELKEMSFIVYAHRDGEIDW